MTAREFEERVAFALRKRGWVTGQSFKGIGMDMFAYTPDGTTACIQFHNGKNPVEAYAIQEIIEGKKLLSCIRTHRNTESQVWAINKCVLTDIDDAIWN